VLGTAPGICHTIGAVTPQPRIDTERLVLRLPEAGDVQPMFEIHQDPDVMRFVGKPGSITVAWRNVAMMIGHWQISATGCGSS